MKTKEELKALKEEVETLRKKLAELSEDELKQVAGGGSMKQKILPPEIDIEVDPAAADIDTRKDLYENVILGSSPEEHNVMLNNALGEEVKVKCPYCFLLVPISKIAAHKAVCSKRD